MAKKRTLEDLEARRQMVISDYRMGFIKSREALKLIKRYDEKIVACRKHND